MAASVKHDVYLEIGDRKTFAGALHWPGWCRSGRDPDAALAALVEYGARYGEALTGSGLEFEPPTSVDELHVIEELQGNSTTDFGAPGAWPEYDSQPLTEAEAERLKLVMKACWQTFDRAVTEAAGQALKKGPRGGGRDLEQMVEHVVEADVAYLARVGHKPQGEDWLDPHERLTPVRTEIEAALDAGVRGDLPEEGPRGGIRWSARYFARRVAWHALDHAWEIEDRIE